MPLLLDLPREIRDEILSLVLFTPPRTAQDFSCYDHQRRALTAPYPDPQGLTWRCHLVKVLPSDLQYNAFFATRASLLLLNRQLNAETLSLLQRKNLSSSYTLDVAIVNDLELWPTWISVPSLSREVDEVHVLVRTVTTQRLGWVGKTNKWLGGDGVPPLAWAFASMLQLFLRYGPLMDVVDYSKQQEENDRKMTIRRLVLDVQSPTETSANYAIGPYDPETVLPVNINKLRLLRRDATDINYVMHQEILLKLLAGTINLVLYYPRYSRLLYERMGTIEIMLDGEVRNEWDLLGWSMRIESETVRQSIYNERQHMGLPVPANSMK